MASVKQRLQQKQVRLGPLGQRILAHWKQFRPKEAKAMEQQGKLLPFVQSLQDRGRELLYQAHQQGLNQVEAVELVNEAVFPPSEEEQPLLGEDPAVSRAEAMEAKRRKAGRSRKGT